MIFFKIGPFDIDVYVFKGFLSWFEEGSYCWDADSSYGWYAHDS